MQRVLISKIEVQFTEYITIPYSTVHQSPAVSEGCLCLCLCCCTTIAMVSTSAQVKGHRGKNTKESKKKKEKKKRNDVEGS
jgi:streptolysin S family bacteriocin protoxin